MTMVEKILEELWNTTLSYKGVQVNMFGIPVGYDNKKKSIYSTLYRLEKKGYVEKHNGEWSTTKLGKKYLEKSLRHLRQFKSPFDKKASRNLLLMFDIPEEKRSERNWLRRQLLIYGYILIQKSVWVGPSPLPKEFTTYVKQIDLADSIKTFKLA